MTHIIALAQCGSLPDISANLMLAEHYILEAKAAGAILVVFPEYFMFPCTEDIQAYINNAQAVDGCFTSRMKQLANRHKIWILFGMNEKSDSSNDKKCYNTLVLLNSNGVIHGIYRKTHLFDAFNWQESSHTLPGDALFIPISTPFGKLGLGTCYDLRFPEVARHAARLGADLLIYPSAWVHGEQKVVQWKTLLAARAIENTITVIGCSQYIQDTFIGQSYACDPFGRVLAEGSEKQELLLVPVSSEVNEHARSLIPSLNNMRKDLY